VQVLSPTSQQFVTLFGLFCQEADISQLPVIISAVVTNPQHQVDTRTFSMKFSVTPALPLGSKNGKMILLFQFLLFPNTFATLCNCLSRLALFPPNRFARSRFARLTLPLLAPHTQLAPDETPLTPCH
jgi:hypothetical protein